MDNKLLKHLEERSWKEYRLWMKHQAKNAISKSNWSAEVAPKVARWLGQSLIVIFVFSGVARAEGVNMDIIAIIESNNNPNAYNKKSGAIGLYQITPIVYEDWKNHNYIYEFEGKTEDGKKVIIHFRPDYFSLRYLFVPEFNKEVADWYMQKRIPQLLRYYKIPDTITNRLIAYNWGIGNLKKWYFSKNPKFTLPQETHDYLIKYYKLARSK